MQEMQEITLNTIQNNTLILGAGMEARRSETIGKVLIPLYPAGISMPELLKDCGIDYIG